MAKPTKLQRVPSRKKRRKQERSAKKARISAYFARQKEEGGSGSGGTPPSGSSDGGVRKGRGHPSTGRARNAPGRREDWDRRSGGQRRGAGAVWGRGASGRGREGAGPTPLGRRAALLSANQREDKVISRLEKLLRLKRRKNKKKLPASFEADGLGCILAEPSARLASFPGLPVSFGGFA